MVAGSNPARGAKFRFIFNYLQAHIDVTRDLARSMLQLRCAGIPYRIAFKRMCTAQAPIATQAAP
ncbi:hypothetical protein, partial [Acinetobacter baumannii]|uniref:hypothetical protein n=1 Tax=Acinetobacter baumannii TaxID=470 RepID=UPI001BB46C85